MSMAYEKSGDWRALGAVTGLHALAIFALLNVESVAQSVGLQQPLMVSLLTPSEPTPPKVIPPPPPPKQQALPPVQAPPILAATETAPAPEVVAPPPHEPTPLPGVLPAPAPTPTPAPPQPVVQAVAAPPPPAPVSAPRFDADYLDNPAPAYPALSRRMGEHGRVLLRVHVTPEGSPAQIEVRESSGFERLDKAARDTVRRWRFVPAKQGDRGVAAWVLVPISFSLRS
jgi:periplasmic protein TonB